MCNIINTRHNTFAYFISYQQKRTTKLIGTAKTKYFY